MIYEINYLLYAFIAVVIAWPLVFIGLINYDLIKRNPFRPFYRAAWPFALLMELIC